MRNEREKLLAALEQLIGGGELNAGDRRSLSDVCRRRLGVCPSDLDEILLEELGLDGEEFFASYGRSVIDIGNKFY